MKTMGFIVIGLILLSGCFSDTLTSDGEPAKYYDAISATVIAWEQIEGPVSDRCLAQLDDVPIYNVNNSPCDGGKGTVRGCCQHTLDGRHMIEIWTARTDEQMQCTAVHEFIHLLGICELNDRDSKHLRMKWWTKYGKRTIEAVGCAIIRADM
jgi:hypothetical protein